MARIKFKKMKEFLLIANDGEKINMTHQECFEDAVEYFSVVKKIDKKNLLKIYKILENKKI